MDLFWSRKDINLRLVCGGLKELVIRARAAERRVLLEDTTSWKVGEDVGMGTAIEMLGKSIKQGKNSDAYMQFNTCRNMRSVATNFYVAKRQA